MEATPPPKRQKGKKTMKTANTAANTAAVAAAMEMENNTPAAVAVNHTAAIAAGLRYGTAAIAYTAAAEVLTDSTARAAALHAAEACRAVEKMYHAAARALYVFNDYDGYTAARAALLTDETTAAAAADIFAALYSTAPFNPTAAAAVELYAEAVAAADEFEETAAALIAYWNTANK